MRALFALIVLFSACTPDTTITADPGAPPVITTEERPELFVTTPSGVTIPPVITFSLNFDDTQTWSMATITCWSNYQPVIYGVPFNQKGWAEFKTDFSQCNELAFNVARGELDSGLELNINPYNIAEIAIDEGSDVSEMQDQPDLAPVLKLWAFVGEYEWGASEMLDPVTQNDPDGAFWGCDEPVWIEPYGMPYSRPPQAYQDYCETTPP